MKDPSTRDVIDYLHHAVGISNRQAQQALLSGLAGPATIDGRARRYDMERAIALGRVTELTDDEVWNACPRGVFIARIGPRRGFHVAQSRAEHVAALADDWYVPWFGHVWLKLNDAPDGTFPFIATLADFVVAGATIVGRELYGAEQLSTNRHFPLTRFTLADPGPWYDALEGRRLTLGPGYPWKIWGAPVSAAFDRTGLADDDVISAVAARVARRRGRPRSPGPLASRPPSAGHPPAQSA